MELDVPSFGRVPIINHIRVSNIIVMVDEVSLVPRERPNGNPALLLILATREVFVQLFVRSLDTHSSFRSPDSNNHTISRRSPKPSTTSGSTLPYSY